MNGETVNLKRLLLQQLRSFESSGISSLPTASGNLTFEIPSDDPVNESDSVSESSSAGGTANMSSDLPGSGRTASQSGEQITQGQGQLAELTVPGSELSLPYPQSLSLVQRKQQLQVLNDVVSECTRCEELAKSRNKTVFGVGSENARLVFLGEGPGADEDRQGEPFVGAAGQLLNKILDACQLSREQVYILNVVKCRPPRNRNPTDAERSCCWEYARQQLEILQPEFICCLGSVAAKSLLNTKRPLGRMRQQFHEYRSSRVIVTYHPAYLLRTPSAKRHVWEDMKLLMRAMGVDL